MSKQSIGVFTLAYPPFIGGAEIAVKKITEKLLDFDFRIFTHDFKKHGHGKLGKLVYIFRAWREAERSHKEKPLEAIWAVMASYAGVAALVFKLRHPKIPFLLTLQEGDSEEHILKRVGVFYPLWKLIFKKADRIQAISSYLADFARRHGAKCPIDVVPNGVDLGAYNTNRTNKSNITNTIITTSRLVYKNGVDVLIDAVKLLKGPLKLEILGDGPQRSALELRAGGAPAEVEINFRGHVDPKQIPEYLRKADIFARPSRSEGLGNSFLEAMAAGLPAIGTPVGGIPDFLIDCETGLSAKVDDPKDLAEKINLLLTNEKLRKKISENGRKLVWEKFSWDLIVGKIGKIFNSTLAKKNLPKVLIAAGIYPPDIGGPATHVQKLYSAFQERGLDVKVLTYGNPEDADVAGVSRNWPPILRQLIYFLKCFRMALGTNIIYAQDATSAGFPSMLAAKILRKRFLIRIGGDILWERAMDKNSRPISLSEYYNQNLHLSDKSVFYRAVRSVLKAADKIAVPAELLKDLYIKHYGIPDKKILVIKNPVPDKEKIMENKKGEPVFVFAGRFIPYKNLPFLIEAFRKIRDEYGEGKLLLIGEGPVEIKVTPGVEIFSKVPHNELLNKIKSASVCIAPAFTEFNPNFILECLSLGKPVLLSRENGLSVELPEEFLFNPKDREELMEKMKNFFDENYYKKALQKISQLETGQTWEKTVAEHLALLGR